MTKAASRIVPLVYFVGVRRLKLSLSTRVDGAQLGVKRGSRTE